MSHLYCAFIRHGDYHQLANTPSALQPYPLNTEGKKQALAGAQELANLLDKYNCMLDPAVDCSNLLRAWQTASIFIEQLQPYFASAPKLVGYDALAERTVGCAANLSIEQIEAVLHQDPRYQVPDKNWKSDSHYCLPLQGAESLLQAGERVKTHLSQWANSVNKLPETIISPEKNKLKLFFGHGAAFRHAAYHLDILTFEQIAALSMYHARPILFKVDNGLFSHIDGHWKIRQQSDLAID
ncbi:histidine phosphatase family protein [Paraglaciecola sp. L3A3]|uniref:histidine phosphatase family protein n=1 Tax=Paraglaciecola sp. L3A3 TaxID=2686358 RepID=UPI00131EA622|nr:phosphoglycerate mutase family protein [Paraglaciecola sp. L3A3]